MNEIEITPAILESAGLKGEMYYKLNNKFKYHIGQKVITLSHKGKNLIVMEILYVYQLKLFCELVGLNEIAEKL